MVSWWHCCLGLYCTTYLLPLPGMAGEPASSSLLDSPVLGVKQIKQLQQTPSSPSALLLITQRGPRQEQRQQFKLPPNTTIPIDEIEVVEIIADRQEYETKRGIVIAEGNVVLRFAQSVMTSDRLEINLLERFAVAQGNVQLQRGEQVLTGERLEYYLVQDRGVVLQAGGEFFQPSLSQDTDFRQRLGSRGLILDRALSDRIQGEQPLSIITAQEGISATVGKKAADLLGRPELESTGVNRLRFEADRIDFDTRTWTAQNLRLTNDPFSPPELELRSATATFERREGLGNKLTTSKSSLVLDNSLRIPFIAGALAFDDRPRSPGLFSIGFDGDDRGGLFIERTWKLLEGENYRWSITPQYFLQRALIPTAFRFSESDEGGLLNDSVFGLTSRFTNNFGARTELDANGALTSLNFSELEDNLRANVSLEQTIGKFDNPYRLALEYNFRDRLFNGSLGFQTVRNSIGGVLTSPSYTLGNTGVSFRYQGSIQNINADTDRDDLLNAVRDNDRINLTRYQAAGFLEKSFSLWRGQGLPPTKDQGLRYTPTPVVPYLELVTGISGVGSFYSNSDSQLSLEGSIGIQGQVGHFSRPWLDYTGFKISYAENLRGDESPFLFDRLADRQTLNLGITQQIYGPVRFGWQTAIDLNDNDEISTDYLLEYSRRTHNLTLRYNPVLEIGSLSFRISDFNWQGSPRPFDAEITPVIQGVD